MLRCWHLCRVIGNAFNATISVLCVLTPVVAFQVMAPLLDTNHELSWQANMVDVIEQKAASQRTEGQSVQLVAHTICPTAAC